jgi:nucleoside-diphosphate-sugar epimerase
MSTLITGATGFIGRHLTARLLNDGVRVRVLTRNRDKLPPEWADRVEVVMGSLLDPEALREATAGVSTVYHLAGEIRDPALMKAINAEAVRSLLESAIAAGVKHFVHLSSVGVVGADSPGTVTEEALCRPKNEYEQTKLEGEKEVLKCVDAGRIEAVILRPTIVFGEGSTNDSVLSWLRAVGQGRFFFIGKEGIANYVYVGDVVEAMVHVTKNPDTRTGIFNVADPAPIRDFVAVMAEVLGVALPTRTLPVPLAYSMGGALEAANRLIGIPAPLTRARVRAMSSKCLFSGDKLRIKGAFNLPVGYREGLVRTVKWYRETGRL